MNTFTTKVCETDDKTVVECQFHGEITVAEAFTQLVASQVQEVNARCSKITLEIY
jgi:hypothetical protein